MKKLIYVLLIIASTAIYAACSGSKHMGSSSSSTDSTRTNSGNMSTADSTVH